jgi:hypothetical protein
VFNNNLLLDIGVFLASSSSRSDLILVLATTSSASGVETVIILLLKVFKGPVATLLTAVQVVPKYRGFGPE